MADPSTATSAFPIDAAPELAEGQAQFGTGSMQLVIRAAQGLPILLVAPIFTVTKEMGALIALKAFAASIVGGFGSIPGAIVGGLAIGVIETFGGFYISSAYVDAIAFVILIAVLLVKPSGLFGERVAEKA